MQMFRRAFGFTEMVARWYRPLYDAFEMIRQANRSSMAHVPIEGMANLANMVAFDPANTTTPLRKSYPTAVDAALGGTLVEVRTCIGRSDNPGIRQLRRLVHQYFAQQDLALDWSGTIPSLRRRTESDPPALGFGLFAGLQSVGSLRERQFGPAVLENAHRQVGLYTPDVLQYALWWKSTFESPAIAVNDRRHNENIQSLGESSVFGWLFTEMKNMARAVALYSVGVITAEPGRTNADIAQSIQEG